MVYSQSFSRATESTDDDVCIIENIQKNSENIPKQGFNNYDGTRPSLNQRMDSDSDLYIQVYLFNLELQG